VVLVSTWAPGRRWLAHPDLAGDPLAVIPAIALWLVMAAPVVLAPVDQSLDRGAVLRAVGGWGLAGSLLLAADLVAHGVLDGSPAAEPVRVAAIASLGAVPLAYGLRRPDRLPAPHGWPMAAMQLVGMANPVSAATLSCSMVLACSPTSRRLVGVGVLLLGVAGATAGG
jgi:hypothetical protein